VTIYFEYADTGTMIITFPNGAPSRTITIYRFGFGTPAAFAPSSGSFQSGWYWNPAESGTGYFIEMQGTQAFIANFMYDTAGQPTWYASVANLSGSNGLAGTLYQYTNGQSIAGAYKSPTLITAGAGNASYNFSTASSATMTLPNGAKVPLSRFAFDSSYSTNTPPVANAGTTQIVTVGTQVTLNGSGTDANGDKLNYYWNWVDAPTGTRTSLINWTSPNPYFLPDLAGTYQLGLVVDDGKASSLISLVTVNAINTTSSSNGCSPATYTPNLPPMIDSLGNQVVESSFGGGDGSAAGGDGSAGDGAPIANAPVTITDANGKTVTTTTDALGYYRVSLKCMTAPFIAKVVRPDGTAWYSASTTSPIQRGFVTMNITGLTDKTVGYVVDAAKIDGGADKITSSILAANSTAFVAAKDKIATGLASPLTSAGLNPAIFDPVSTPYKAVITDSYDKLLEKLDMVKEPLKGKTVVVATLAGVRERFLNGNIQTATFNWPSKIVLDKSGNIFISDSSNNAIRKITPSGEVSTFAGGTKGYADGYGTEAKFTLPDGLAIDGNGNLFVADTYNSAIRKITPEGLVSTIAGGVRGYANGAGPSAKFDTPTGIAVDNYGNIFVSDFNHVIRKINPSGLVSSFVGGLSSSVLVDGIGTNSSFYYPAGLSFDSAGNLYVADSGYNAIRKVTSQGLVTTIAGGTRGFIDGLGKVANFNSPQGITVDVGGNLYVSDQYNQAIRKINPIGFVITIAGSKTGFSNANGVAASFNYPDGIAIDGNGNLLVVDTFNNAIRKINPSGIVSTLSGKGPTQGYIDATGTDARFNAPWGLAVDNAGNVFVADSKNNVVRKITSKGVVTTIANVSDPRGLALDGVGNIFVGSNNKVLKISASGSISTFAGSGLSGLTDGLGTAATFTGVYGMVIDKSGNIYVADFNNSIRKITPSGIVSTFAGGKTGFDNGVGLAASFSGPTGVTIDSKGNLFVADRYNNAVRKITPEGVVSTFAGGTQIINGCTMPDFCYPVGITIDKYDNLIVTDLYNHSIRKITPSGLVSTIAGDGIKGYTNTGAGARFNEPQSVAVSSDGIIFVSDTNNDAVRVILP